MAHIADMEACYDALMGTPTKRATTQRMGSAKRSSKTPGDRFIPNRRAMDMNVSHFELTRGDAENANASPAKEEYKKELAAKLNMAAVNKVLAFSNKAPKPAEEHQNSLRVLYSQNREAGLAPKKYTRHIPQAPERILDAPEMLDDYYLNLLDWGKNNVLSIALGSSIYLWNASDGSIQELMQTPGDTHVTSLNWMQEGNYLAVGTSDHKVQLWDADKLKQVRSMNGHRARVSSLAWNNHLLSSGGRDSQIIHHDVRVAEHKVGVLKGHTQEVCGLKWSPWGTQLASGGNDNLLNIWDDRWQRASSHHSSPHLEQGSYGQPLFRLERHVAAVKAIAWCPWQRNLLASGGGTADRTAACSDRRPPWAVPPSSAPAPPQGAPDGSGRRNTPRGRGRGHWAPRHCLGRSSEPPPKAADSTPPPLPRAGTIRFWNSNSGMCLNAVDTRSQACNRSNARLQPLATHARNRSNAPLQPYEYACNNPVT